MTRPDCDDAMHAIYKSSIQALSLRSRGALKVWPDRPDAGLLYVSGQCRSCDTSLTIEVPDAAWSAFSGQDVPAWVEPWPEAVAS